MVSVVLGVILVPLVGKMADSIDPRCILPTAFLTRVLAIAAFCFIGSPASFYAYGVSVLLVLGTVMENVTVDVILLRNADKQIRGVIYGFAIACGYLGQMFFAAAGGILFDRVGPYWPFILVGALDLAFAMLCMLLSCCGVIVNDLKDQSAKEQEN